MKQNAARSTRGMHRLIRSARDAAAIAAISGVILVGLVLAMAGTSAAAGERHRISGDLVIDEPAAPGELCGSPARSSPYSDITAGTRITIKPKGKRAVHTKLGQGVGNADSRCEFPFAVGVPDARRYRIAIPDRGTITFTKRDMKFREWEVVLALGVPSSEPETP